MASGSFTQQYVSGHYNLRVVWSSSTNPTSNTSDVDVNVYLDNDWALSMSAGRAVTITVGNSTYNFTTSSSITTTGSHLLASQNNVSVSHNSDGTKSVAIKATFAFNATVSGTYVGTMSASKTVTLTTIDRNPPTVTGSVTYNGGTSVTIKATSSNASSNFQYSINNGSTWSNLTADGDYSASITRTLSGTTYTTKVRATRTYNNVVGTSSAFTIDLTAPTVSVTTSNVTTSGFKITASATYTCNTWQYKIGLGSWTNFSTSPSYSSASQSITGLSPNTTYTVQVRATRVSNGIVGTSSSTSVKTLQDAQASVLNSVTIIDIDNGSPSITLGMTVYDKSFKHDLYFIYPTSGGTTKTTIHNIKATSTGSVSVVVPIPSSNVNDIISMPEFADKTALLFRYELGTFTSGGTQVGSNSAKNGNIRIRPQYSSPVFTGTPSVTEGNNAVSTLLGAGNYAENASDISVSFPSATAQNGATLDHYDVIIGPKTVTGGSPVSFGSIPIDGANTTVTVTAVDSRGYKTSISDVINVLPYETPQITELTIARVNNYETQANLKLEGYYSPVTMSGIDKNSISSIVYHKKIAGAGSWDADVDITSAVTIDTVDQTFSYTTSSLESGNLNRANAYEFEFVITDALGNTTVARSVPDGTPVMSLRKAKVGINEPDPQYALDVDGTANITGVTNLNPTSNTYTPSISWGTSGGSGTPTLSNVNFYYSVVGNVMQLSGIFQITTMGNSGNASLRIDLPSGYTCVLGASNANAPVGTLNPVTPASRPLIACARGSNYLYCVGGASAGSASSYMSTGYYMLNATLIVNYV